MTAGHTVVVHDFSGHPFQAELSRKLAEHGLTVEHVSARQYVSGKGHLERQPGDPDSLTFTEIGLDRQFEKYSPISRIRWERAYGRAWVKRLRQQRPSAVVACNIPLFALRRFARYARRANLPWIMWHQDIYSFGMADEVARRLPGPAARIVAKLLTSMEARIIGRASHVVAIGDAFTDVYGDWGIDAAKVSVIPNWAPLDRIFPVERENSRTADLFPSGQSFRMVYAGTLGRKHNPDLLPALVEQVRSAGVDAHLVVVSEGEGADVIAASSAAGAGSVEVFGFQPADELPQVLGSADVLVALLEPTATKFSIPSKVLSYMAAGRPIVGLMPADNPAAVDIAATGGFVGTPDADGVTAATEWLTQLAADRSRIDQIGRQTRDRAEAQFDVDRVANRFAEVIGQITAH